MLYLITTPVDLHPGNYKCTQVDSAVATELIQKAEENGELKPYVNFGSTRFALQKLTGVKVDLVRKVSIPAPRDGDEILSVRLNEKPEGGRVEPEHLDFFLVQFDS